MHIGLGNNKKIDFLEITWPNGKKETFNNIAIDSYIIIIEGKGIEE